MEQHPYLTVNQTVAVSKLEKALRLLAEAGVVLAWDGHRMRALDKKWHEAHPDVLTAGGLPLMWQEVFSVKETD